MLKYAVRHSFLWLYLQISSDDPHHRYYVLDHSNLYRTCGTVVLDRKTLAVVEIREGEAGGRRLVSRSSHEAYLMHFLQTSIHRFVFATHTYGVHLAFSHFAETFRRVVPPAHFLHQHLLGEQVLAFLAIFDIANTFVFQDGFDEVFVEVFDRSDVASREQWIQSVVASELDLHPQQLVDDEALPVAADYVFFRRNLERTFARIFKRQNLAEDAVAIELWTRLFSEAAAGGGAAASFRRRYGQFQHFSASGFAGLLADVYVTTCVHGFMNSMNEFTAMGVAPEFQGLGLALEDNLLLLNFLSFSHYRGYTINKRMLGGATATTCPDLQRSFAKISAEIRRRNAHREFKVGVFDPALADFFISN